jgi:N-acetylglutamate synthase-like GNAT family acetyltransferase
MEIRQASGRDADIITILNQELRLDLPGFIWHERRWIKENIGNFHLYIKRKRARGAICVVLDDDTAEIETLAVAKDWQRKGIGSALVEFAQIYARYNGKKQLITRSVHAYDAKDFYLKCGFTLRDEPWECPSGRAHDFYMDL